MQADLREFGGSLRSRKFPGLKTACASSGTQTTRACFFRAHAWLAGVSDVPEMKGVQGRINAGRISLVSNFSLSPWASRTWKLVVVMTTTASSSGNTSTLLPPEPAMP